ncbi:ral guanine nucleotide dissociation stimulator-like [Thomomys bottae]
MQDKKDQEHPESTVNAIIAQSKKVSSCVVTTCLGNRTMVAADRARVIEHWIKVASHCETLKNFASLQSIISALQSKAIQRLKKTWKEVSRDSFQEFQRLSKYFAPEQKDALRRKQLIQGTIPYLGAFLAELESVDKEMPDFHCGRVINVEKLRKQFKIISEIERLQASCSAGNIQPDESFQAWFESVPRLSEAESYRLACELEPQSNSTKKAESIKPKSEISKPTRKCKASNPESSVPCSSQTSTEGKTCAEATDV